MPRVKKARPAKSTIVPMKEYVKVFEQVKYNASRYMNQKTGKWFFGEKRKKFKNVTCSKLAHYKQYYIALGNKCPFEADLNCHCRTIRPQFIEAIDAVILMHENNTDLEIEQALQKLRELFKKVRHCNNEKTTHTIQDNINLKNMKH